MARTQALALENTGKEGKNHRTGASAAEQGGKRAAAWTGAAGVPQTTDAPDCNVRGRARRQEGGPKDWSNRGTADQQRPELKHPGQRKAARRRPPGLEHPGEECEQPCTGSSRDDQEGGATNEPAPLSTGDKLAWSNWS